MESKEDVYYTTELFSAEEFRCHLHNDNIPYQYTAFSIWRMNHNKLFFPFLIKVRPPTHRVHKPNTHGADGIHK